MDYKHCCVVDRNHFFVSYVQVMLEPDESGAIVARPEGHSLRDGERLADVGFPYGLVRPILHGSEWREAASPEEIEAAKPEPEKPVQPSEIAVLKAQVQALSDRADFNEDCLAEMAGAVYA